MCIAQFTIYIMHSVNCVKFSVYIIEFIWCFEQFTVSRLGYAVYIMLWIVYSMQCNVYSLKFSVWSLHYAVTSVQYEVYCTQCAVYNLRCTVLDVNCAGYSVACSDIWDLITTCRRCLSDAFLSHPVTMQCSKLSSTKLNTKLVKYGKQKPFLDIKLQIQKFIYFCILQHVQFLLGFSLLSTTVSVVGDKPLLRRTFHQASHTQNVRF